MTSMSLEHFAFAACVCANWCTEARWQILESRVCFRQCVENWRGRSTVPSCQLTVRSRALQRRRTPSSISPEDHTTDVAWQDFSHTLVDGLVPLQQFVPSGNLPQSLSTETSSGLVVLTTLCDRCFRRSMCPCTHPRWQRPAFPASEGFVASGLHQSRMQSIRDPRSPLSSTSVPLLSLIALFADLARKASSKRGPSS